MTELSFEKQDLLNLLTEREALKFGSFTLKSGRQSPYFINMGSLSQANDLVRLGRAYAETMLNKVGNPSVIFGPAYKGIPLAIATSIAFSNMGFLSSWAFDRKEVKDHGEGGMFVGAPLGSGTSVVIVDDVITAGTAIRQTIEKVQAAGAWVQGVVVAFDREERGLGSGQTALEEIRNTYGISVAACLTISQVIEHLYSIQKLDYQQREEIKTYLGRNG